VTPRASARQRADKQDINGVDSRRRAVHSYTPSRHAQAPLPNLRPQSSLSRGVLFDKLHSLRKKTTKASETAALAAAFWLENSKGVQDDGQIGLIIERSAPHAVIVVDNIVDSNYVRQGMPGYSNEEVLPGDRLVAVDGHRCVSESIEHIYSMLKGRAGTEVELSLSRRDSFELYKVRVMRHRPGAAGSPSAASSSTDDEAVQPRGVAGTLLVDDRISPNRAHGVVSQQRVEGFVGLKITEMAPYCVKAVKNMMDMNGIKQGMPGYSNEEVFPGDQLVAVDGRKCALLSLRDVYKLLKGYARTEVMLTLQRKKNHSLYKVRVMRHSAEDGVTGKECAMTAVRELLTLHEITPCDRIVNSCSLSKLYYSTHSILLSAAGTCTQA